MMAASDSFWALMNEIIEWKRKNPGDDLLTGMIAAEDDGDRLSLEELNEQALLLYVAGHETTVNLIGNGMLALCRNRDQLEKLQRDPSLDANAIEELLRFDGPVQMSRRINLADYEVGGKQIPKGSLMMTCLGAANRDPERWERPDEFDIERSLKPSFGFGGGFHSCLGAHLARVEGQVAIGTLIRRFPDLELASDTQEWNGRIVLRGLNRLPVVLNA